MSRMISDRRRFLLATASVMGGSALAGCDRIANTTLGRRALALGDDANFYVQRLLLGPQKLAPEYAEADISPRFKANGTEDPADPDYKALVRRKFAGFRLEVGGLVERPFKISLPELRQLEARTQITRHDCVEGWTCIGKWTGVPLRVLLERAGLKPNARYIIFHCADTMDAGGSALEGGDDDESDAKTGDAKASDAKASDAKTSDSKTSDSKTSGGQASDDGSASRGTKFYGSIDLADAYHPQTILAYDMNGAPLPVAHGAPLRLRLERQLGYKMSKYVMRLEVVESFAAIGQGRGGYWEDNGYAWYAGI